MTKFLLAAGLILSLTSKAYSQYCPSCVQNSAAIQQAQFNISSATIRGALSVGSINISTINVSTITSSVYIGSGTFLTNLNASQLLFGTVPSAAISGNYPGITGIGAITASTWTGSIIQSSYGGTGANLGTANPGSIPYFSSVGTMSALSPGTATYLLQSNGASAPSYTHAPQVLGTNVTAIPLANLIPGELPTTISVNDASISTVSAAKVIGNIPGKASNITGNLPLTQLSTGTLVNTIVASSITASGATPGIYGGPLQLIQETVGSDGRITSISQSTFSVAATSISAGALPAGVTIGATQITAGSLGSSVIASSLNATGVIAGSYGFASQTSSITVRSDGRLSFANNVPIAINTSQINSGTLTAGVLVPASNVQAGSLASNVIASSVAASGVAAGTYGNGTNSVRITLTPDGRVTSVSQFPIPNASTGSYAQKNIDNGWTATQTFFASVTIHNDLSATNLAGSGVSITHLSPSNMDPGNLPSNVVASSVSLTNLTVASSVTAGAFFGDGSHLTGISGETNYFAAAKTFGSSVTVKGSILSLSSVTASAFFGDGSHISNISGVCSVGSGTSSIVCQGSGNSTPLANFAVVSGGQNNTASANLAFVGGGSGNTAGFTSVVVGGASNTTSFQYDFIGGGQGNTADGGDSTIGGGSNNIASGSESVVGGGPSNTASGQSSVVPGGASNIAEGNASFAAGTKSHANQNGSFVMSDSNNVIYNSHGQDTFNIRFTTGIYLDTANGVFVSSGFLNVLSSSITASAFFGDGSHLGGVLPLAGGTLTGALNITNVALTLTGNTGSVVSAASVTASAFFGDGSHETFNGSSFTANGSYIGVTGSSITSPTVAISTLIVLGADNTGKTGGFIGIGTSQPGFMIDIQNANAGNGSGIKSRASSNSSANIFWQESFDTGGNTGGAVGNIIRGDFGRGTPTTVLPAQAGDIFLQLSARGAFSANPPATAMSASSQGTMFFSATENISTNTWGTQFQIQLSSAGTGLRNAYYTFSSSAGAMRISMLDNSSGYQTDFRSYFSTHTVLLATNRGDGDFIVKASTSAPVRFSFGAPTDSLFLNNIGALNVVSSVTASAFFGVGSGLANLNASQLLQGAVPNAALSGSYTSVTGLGTQVQALNMGSNQIHNVVDPSAPQDAATQNYVLSNLNGLQYKSSARLATTTPLPSNVYNNGSSGVGATLTGLGVGQLTIDGAVANLGDRVLVNNEVQSANNGIYVVTQNSTLVVYMLTRSADYNQPSEMANGSALFIDSGTVNNAAGFVNTSSVTTVGTSAVNFSQFNGLGDVSVGPGLLKSGNTLSVDSSSVAFLTSGNLITYSSAQNGGVGFFTSSTITANSSQLFWDNNNHRLGVRTNAPAHGFHMSSATFYLDGNSANPILVGNAGSTMTLTSGGNLTVSGSFSATSSSVNASAFFGDGSHITNYAITVDSTSSNAVSVASTSDIALSTVSASLRGSRFLQITVTVEFNNTSGANRTYELQVFQDGVPIGNQWTQIVSNGTDQLASIQSNVPVSPSGVHYFAINVHSNNATGTQTVSDREISIVEH